VIHAVAEFEPVIWPHSVSRANIDNAMPGRLDLHEGDTVVVAQAGEIIPRWWRVAEASCARQGQALPAASNCPECGSTLVREEGEAATACVNSAARRSCGGALRMVEQGGPWMWVARRQADRAAGGQGLVDSIALSTLDAPARQPGADGRDISLKLAAP